MLQVARVAPKLLGESTDLVRAFLLRQQNEDGGFRDRAGRSDLYYTVFGLEGLVALQFPVPSARVDAFLDPFETGGKLDLVHLCSLVRCRSTLAQAGGRPLASDWAAAAAEHLAAFRASDGGFHHQPGSPHSTVYASFLGLAACQDLKVDPGLRERMPAALQALRTEDGGWANERQIRLGATNATAAAVTALRNLSAEISPSVGDWLLARVHAQGGFVAANGVPMPDLLSTATALHALSGLQRSIEPIRERCLDFIDTLWTNEGAFHGHWDDGDLDAEYAYYALLALGHLAL